MSRTVIVHMGDRHAGLMNGLCPPEMELVYGKVTDWLTPGMSEEQIAEAKSNLDVRKLNLSSWSKWLWDDVWLPGVEFISKLAGDDPVVLFDSGDNVHGSRFVESLYSPFIHHQVSISVESMRPWRKLNNLFGIAMSYGTGSHDFGSNAAALQVYEGLAPWGYKMWLDDHVNMLLDGVRFDLAHHGSNLSKRRHLKFNTARLDFEQLIRENLEFDESYSDVYMRGHFHRDAIIPIHIDWAGKYIKSLAMINPPMCGPNGYARQAARSMESISCGFNYLVIDDGKVVDYNSYLVRKDTRSFYVVNTGNVSFYQNREKGLKRPGRKKKKQK
jgi:hypothetical protein